MTQINSLATLKQHAKALNAELTAVFKKYGLTYNGCSARIGEGQLRYNIKLRYALPSGKSAEEAA